MYKVENILGTILASIIIFVMLVCFVLGIRRNINNRSTTFTIIEKKEGISYHYAIRNSIIEGNPKFFILIDSYGNQCTKRVAPDVYEKYSIGDKIVLP